MSKNLNFLKRLIIFFIGISIISFGVSLFITTNVGSDPFTVFTQGIANLLNNLGVNATTGTANRVIMVVLFAVVLVFDRARLKIGTIICVIIVGPIIDFGVDVLQVLPIDSYSYIIKLGLVGIGCFIIAIGFSILTASNVGVAPNDIVPFILQDKLKTEYRWVRIGLDATFLIVGFLLGGVVGLGTVIAMLTTGPFIQFCLPYGEKIMDSILNQEEILTTELN